MFMDLIRDAGAYEGGYGATVEPTAPLIAPVLTVRQPVLKQDVTSSLGATVEPPRSAGQQPPPALPGRVPGVQPLGATTVDETRYGTERRGDSLLATLTYAPNIVGTSLAPHRPSDPTAFLATGAPAIVPTLPLHVPRQAADVEAPAGANARPLPWLLPLAGLLAFAL